MQNLHTHTTFDDGKSTAEELVQAALAAGFDALGFSGHSPIAGEDWTMRDTAAYRAEIARLKEKYADRITLFCGLEYDVVTGEIDAEYDYLLGAVHFLQHNGRRETVDNAREINEKLIADWFGGDWLRMAQAYYAGYAALAAEKRVDIVAHLDLLTKFDENEPLFDAAHPAYQEAAVAALEALNRAEKLFEINTGAIARGYRATPYPAPFLLRRLCQCGGRIVLTTDCHDAAKLSCALDAAAALAMECGFRERWELTKSGFVPVPLT